ncbi:MAG: hypothetical protein WAX44_02500 [Minisyncoccia bacterium]
MSMLKSKLLRQTVALLAIIGVLYFFAEIFYLHWTVWWYDVMLHSLSGVCAGMAYVFFSSQYFWSLTEDNNKTIFLGLVFVFVVGVLWEVYEIKFDHTSFKDGIYYIRDTISDLIADVSGGFFGITYGLRFLKVKK